MSCLLLRAEVEHDMGLTACRQRASNKRNFMDCGAEAGAGAGGFQFMYLNVASTNGTTQIPTFYELE